MFVEIRHAWDIFTPSGEEGEMQPNKSSGILLQVEAKEGDCMTSSWCLINKHISSYISPI